MRFSSSYKARGGSDLVCALTEYPVHDSCVQITLWLLHSLTQTNGCIRVLLFRHLIECLQDSVLTLCWASSHPQVLPSSLGCRFFGRVHASAPPPRSHSFQRSTWELSGLGSSCYTSLLETGDTVARSFPKISLYMLLEGCFMDIIGFTDLLVWVWINSW